MIKAENIVKSYTNGRTVTEVLKDISLEITGGLSVILGASGSGKSTLLSVLSGLETPDRGKVFCAGEELTSMTDKERTEFRRRKVAFVFQQYFLLPHLTAEKNVKLGADLAGNKDFMSVIEAVGLGDKKNKFPAELSGGEQQRVSIARALVKNPEILFLDEPTGALDEATGRSVIDTVCRLQKEKGFTAVMVTHNRNLARIADTVIEMNSGRIADFYKNESPEDAYGIGW